MIAATGRNILVFDAGSSALKAVVFSPSGDVVTQALSQYVAASAPHRHPPADWWRAAVAAAHKINEAEIGAIVLTGTMENLMAVGEDGEALGDAVLYPDPCGAPFLIEAGPALAEAEADRLCGNTPEPLMTGFKLLWMRAHEPGRFAAARWFLPGAKDFLLLKLTGEVVTDPTCAATTGIMDIASRDWSNPLRTIFGVERRRLPHIRPATDIVGPLTPEAAEALGLSEGIPVINGCGQAGATTMGGGADVASDVSLYIGTSGWLARVAGPATLAEKSGFYRLPHPVGAGIIEIAPMLSAGAAADWARGLLRLAVDDAEALASHADAAPGEVLFLPYLMGERSPFLDLEVRGAFFGLSPGDSMPELYYAVLEGVALSINAKLQAMGGAGRKVSLVGGGALSPTWRQVIADVVGRPISLPADPVSATSFGAFRIAQRALRRPVAAGSFTVAAKPRAERQGRVQRQHERFAQATELVRQFR